MRGRQVLKEPSTRFGDITRLDERFHDLVDPTNVFSTSQQVIGKAFAADYASPTPANLTTAVGDMALAFTDAAGRAPDVTEPGPGASADRSASSRGSRI